MGGGGQGTHASRKRIIYSKNNENQSIDQYNFSR